MPVTIVKQEGLPTKYKCDACEYQCGKLLTLQEHVRVVHEGRLFECDLCDYSVGSSNNLRIHKQSKHEGVRYPCGQEWMDIGKTYSESR